MNKKHLNRMLRILLMPYCEKSFCCRDQDIIENIRFAYAKLRKRNQMFQRVEREECLHTYESSEKARNRFFQLHPEYFYGTLDDAVMLMNLFFPEDEIANIYERSMENPHSIEIYYLKNLFWIAESLLTFRDGMMSVRTWTNPGKKQDNRYFDTDLFGDIHAFDKTETWNLLNRMMASDVLIAAFMVRADLGDAQYLPAASSEVRLTDKILETVLKKGVGETHFHMNAGVAYEYYWGYATNFCNWEKALVSEESYEKRLRICGLAAVFRLVLAYYLEQPGEEETFEQFINSGKRYSELSAILAQLYCHKISYGKSWQILYENMKRYFQIHMNAKMVLEEGEDYLFETIYRKYQACHVSSEMILLVKCLQYLERHPYESYLMHLFFQYLRRKNIFYVGKMQANQIEGLKNFRIFNEEIRNANKLLADSKGTVTPKKQIRLIFQSISGSKYLKKLEFRTNPPIMPIDQLKSKEGKFELKRKILQRVEFVLQGLREYAWDMTGHSDEEIKSKPHILNSSVKKGILIFPAIGVIFHFRRCDYVDNRIADTCWLLDEKAHPEGSMHILRWREQMISTAKQIENLRSEIPLLADYIVGIDVASEENLAEPWVFAPVYSEIRNRYITKPILKEGGNIQKINNIGFTYHVGEEFRHVLSGLRHVDEVIRFFHYKAGDRIGHAIVLGIDIDRWGQEHESVVMPVGEYMEDLLWLWGSMVKDQMDLELSIDIVEGKILEFAKSIYGDITGITPNMLYDAYCEKFKRDNSGVFERMRKEIWKEKGENTEHFCRWHPRVGLNKGIWTKEKILCTYFCPVYYQKFQKPIMVNVSFSVIRVMKAVREQIIYKIGQMGIYVEANPTSNLAIGSARNMDDSHVFRLNFPGTISEGSNQPLNPHKLLLTLNTDDLSIFNTTSENELAYMYHSMTHQGYSKEDALLWIDKIRQYGLDSSFVREIRSPGQQYMEIDKLLREIESYKQCY